MSVCPPASRQKMLPCPSDIQAPKDQAIPPPKLFDTKTPFPPPEFPHQGFRPPKPHSSACPRCCMNCTDAKRHCCNTSPYIRKCCSPAQPPARSRCRRRSSLTARTSHNIHRCPPNDLQRAQGSISFPPAKSLFRQTYRNPAQMHHFSTKTVHRQSLYPQHKCNLSRKNTHMHRFPESPRHFVTPVSYLHLFCHHQASEFLTFVSYFLHRTLCLFLTPVSYLCHSCQRPEAVPRSR